jgi:hypothetical protein
MVKCDGNHINGIFEGKGAVVGGRRSLGKWEGRLVGRTRDSGGGAGVSGEMGAAAPREWDGNRVSWLQRKEAAAPGKSDDTEVVPSRGFQGALPRRGAVGKREGLVFLRPVGSTSRGVHVFARKWHCL